MNWLLIIGLVMSIAITAVLHACLGIAAGVLGILLGVMTSLVGFLTYPVVEAFLADLDEWKKRRRQKAL